MAAQIDDLINQLAALEVADATRHSKRLQFPGAEMVIEFEKIACEMMGWTRSGSKPPVVMAKLWELLLENTQEHHMFPRGLKKKHLLWGLYLFDEGLFQRAQHPRGLDMR
jgi:hypothetical protein